VRILFVALSFPLPANNGHKIRTWSLLRGLAALGHDVDLLAFSRRDENDAEHAAALEVCRSLDIVPLAWSSSTATDYVRRASTLLTPQPFGVRRFVSGVMRDAIAKHVDGGTVDAIVCDVFTATNLPPITVPLLLNLENVEHVFLRRYLGQERSLLKRAYAWLEWWKMRRWEQDLCARATHVMACSEQDRHYLAPLCQGVPISVVPNTVDTDAFAPMGGEDPLTVIYQGGMDWYPNRDAVEFFAHEILPRLRGRVPGVRFVVAGRNPSPDLRRRLADIPGVSFTGTVADMRPEIARAAVCVAPLRIGSGTRLKILEAAAMGRPVVATRLGAEGLEFVPGEEILLADAPEDFAEMLASLLQDEGRRCAIGLAGRRRVETQYNFTALRRALVQVLRTAEHAREITRRRPTQPSPLRGRA
jgi:polysaccharide biosynthesis protein PslH